MIQLTDSAVAAIKTAISRASENAAAGLQTAEGLQDHGPDRRLRRLQIHDGARSPDPRRRRRWSIRTASPCSSTASSQPHLAGMTVDFVTGLESSGFVFENPNASSKCSCGKSFS